MFVLEFKDYLEVREDLDKLNEGILGNLWGKLKEKIKMWLKGVAPKIDSLIAPRAVNDMIDKKTGQLVGNIVNQEDIANVEKPVNEIFDQIKSHITEGKYFLTGLQFLQDALESTDNLYKQEIAGKQLARGGDRNKSISAGISSALKQRGREFDQQLRVNVKKLKDNINAEVQQLISKVGSQKMPTAKLMAETRFRNAQNVLLVIEYLFKKRRWHIEDLGELSDEMVNSYKETIKLESELADKLKAAEAEINNTGTDAENTGTEDTEATGETNIVDEVRNQFQVGQEVNYTPGNTKYNSQKIQVKIVDFNDNGVIVSAIKDGKQSGRQWIVTYEKFKERTA